MLKIYFRLAAQTKLATNTKIRLLRMWWQTVPWTLRSRLPDLRPYWWTKSAVWHSLLCSLYLILSIGSTRQWIQEGLVDLNFDQRKNPFPDTHNCLKTQNIGKHSYIFVLWLYSSSRECMHSFIIFLVCHNYSIHVDKKMIFTYWLCV